MRLSAAMAAALFVAGCASTRSHDRQPEWLVGTWLMLGDDIEHPAACDSGLPIHYSADRSYQLFEESGSWGLEGDRLTETALEVTEQGDAVMSEIGRPFTSRVERLGPDEFRKTFVNGATATFRRCPGR